MSKQGMPPPFRPPREKPLRIRPSRQLSQKEIKALQKKLNQEKKEKRAQRWEKVNEKFPSKRTALRNRRQDRKKI